MKSFCLLLIIVLSTFAEQQGLKGQNSISKKDEKYRLVVKFKSDAIINVVNGKPLTQSKYRSRNDINNILTNKSFTQIINFSQSETALLNTSRTISPSTKNGFNKEKFKGLVYLDNAETLSADSVLAIANELEKLDIVEYAALEPVELTPPPQVVTPDYTGLQYYRKLNHNPSSDDTIGINIDYAWSIGVKGKGVKIADIEWGFDYNHEDLKRDNFIELRATTNHDYDNHGTSVVGILFAKKNDYGMTGMVHEADTFFGISEITDGRPSAIALALENLDEGDVLIYEMQTGGAGGEYVPADYNQAVWDLTKEASKAGIIVVAAAGNGEQNLDSEEYRTYMVRGDNGSIIVGAGTISGRNRTGFSTYGSRVNLQGYGNWCVATTGSGNLFNEGPNRTYTDNFSGTSSATPIVASAVVAVQSFAKQVLQRTLTPAEMRELLINTGTPQGSGGHIGPLPNVEAAIKKLSEQYGVNKFRLSLNALNGEIVSSETSELIDSGTVVTLEAIANTNYTFKNWQGGLSGNTNPTSITMNSNKNVTAIFEEEVKENNYTLTLSASNGTISASPQQDSYSVGETVTIKQNANEQMFFTGFGGDVNSFDDSLVLTITQDTYIEAYFHDKPLVVDDFYGIARGNRALDSLLRTSFYAYAYAKATVDTSQLRTDTSMYVSYYIPQQEDENHWPGMGLASFVDQSIDSVTHIRLTYKSNDSIYLELIDSVLAPWVFKLNPSETFTTVDVSINSFSQPSDWGKETGVYNPLKITSISLNPNVDISAKSVNGFIEISDMRLIGMKEPATSALASNNPLKYGFRVAVMQNVLQVNTFEQGKLDIKIYTVNGRQVFETNTIARNGIAAVKLPNHIAKGIMIVNVSSKKQVHNTRLLLK